MSPGVRKFYLRVRRPGQRKGGGEVRGRGAELEFARDLRGTSGPGLFRLRPHQREPGVGRRFREFFLPEKIGDFRFRNRRLEIGRINFIGSVRIESPQAERPDFCHRRRFRIKSVPDCRRVSSGKRNLDRDGIRTQASENSTLIGGRAGQHAVLLKTLKDLSVIVMALNFYP